MTDKELIKQEIEYRLSSGKYSINSKQALEDIIVFIDSLPEEFANEDLEEAANFYANTHIEWFDSEGNPCVMPAFKAGAEWQKQQMKESLQTEYEKGRFDMREEMMKDAVSGEVVYSLGTALEKQYKVTSERIKIDGLKFGDKVKIIIIKEE